MFNLLDGWPDADNQEGLEPVDKSREPEFIAELIDRQKYTPDFKNIRMREDNLLFVYDEFQRTGLYNYHLKDAKYLGQGKTAYNQYQMKISQTTPIYPVVFIHEVENPGYIRGEVFAVSPETIQVLDRLNRNGEVFERKEKAIICVDQAVPTKKGPKSPSVKCWMYVGLRPFWKDKKLANSSAIIPGGTNAKRYYEFAAIGNRTTWGRASPWSTMGMTEEEKSDWHERQMYGGQEYMM